MKTNATDDKFNIKSQFNGVSVQETTKKLEIVSKYWISDTTFMVVTTHNPYMYIYLLLSGHSFKILQKIAILERLYEDLHKSNIIWVCSK